MVGFKGLEKWSKIEISGADIIECDVGVTKDKEMVCLHDSFLSTTTNVESM